MANVEATGNHTFTEQSQCLGSLLEYREWIKHMVLQPDVLWDKFRIKPPILEKKLERIRHLATYIIETFSSTFQGSIGNILTDEELDELYYISLFAAQVDNACFEYRNSDFTHLTKKDIVVDQDPYDCSKKRPKVPFVSINYKFSTQLLLDKADLEDSYKLMTNVCRDACKRMVLTHKMYITWYSIVANQVIIYLRGRLWKPVIDDRILADWMTMYNFVDVSVYRQATLSESTNFKLILNAFHGKLELRENALVYRKVYEAANEASALLEKSSTGFDDPTKSLVYKKPRNMKERVQLAIDKSNLTPSNTLYNLYNYMALARVSTDTGLGVPCVVLYKYLIRIKEQYDATNKLYITDGTSDCKKMSLFGILWKMAQRESNAVCSAYTIEYFYNYLEVFINLIRMRATHNLSQIIVTTICDLYPDPNILVRLLYALKYRIGDNEKTIRRKFSRYSILKNKGKIRRIVITTNDIKNGLGLVFCNPQIYQQLTYYLNTLIETPNLSVQMFGKMRLLRVYNVYYMTNKEGLNQLERTAAMFGNLSTCTALGMLHPKSVEFNEQVKVFVMQIMNVYQELFFKQCLSPGLINRVMHELLQVAICLSLSGTDENLKDHILDVLQWSGLGLDCITPIQDVSNLDQIQEKLEYHQYLIGGFIVSTKDVANGLERMRLKGKPCLNISSLLKFVDYKWVATYSIDTIVNVLKIYRLFGVSHLNDYLGFIQLMERHKLTEYKDYNLQLKTLSFPWKDKSVYDVDILEEGLENWEQTKEEMCNVHSIRQLRHSSILGSNGEQRRGIATVLYEERRYCTPLLLSESLYKEFMSDYIYGEGSDTSFSYLQKCVKDYYQTPSKYFNTYKHHIMWACCMIFGPVFMTQDVNIATFLNLIDKAVSIDDLTLNIVPRIMQKVDPLQMRKQKNSILDEAFVQTIPIGQRLKKQLDDFLIKYDITYNYETLEAGAGLEKALKCQIETDAIIGTSLKYESNKFHKPRTFFIPIAVNKEITRVLQATLMSCISIAGDAMGKAVDEIKRLTQSYEQESSVSTGITVYNPTIFSIDMQSFSTMMSKELFASGFRLLSEITPTTEMQQRRYDLEKSFDSQEAFRMALITNGDKYKPGYIDYNPQVLYATNALVNTYIAMTSQGHIGYYYKVDGNMEGFANKSWTMSLIGILRTAMFRILTDKQLLAGNAPIILGDPTIVCFSDDGVIHMMIRSKGGENEYNENVARIRDIMSTVCMECGVAISAGKTMISSNSYVFLNVITKFGTSIPQPMKVQFKIYNKLQDKFATPNDVLAALESSVEACANNNVDPYYSNFLLHLHITFVQLAHTGFTRDSLFYKQRKIVSAPTITLTYSSLQESLENSTMAFGTSDFMESVMYAGFAPLLDMQFSRARNRWLRNNLQRLLPERDMFNTYIKKYQWVLEERVKIFDITD